MYESVQLNRLVSTLSCLIVFVAVAERSFGDEPRTWRSRSGQHSLTATFLGVDGDRVRLKTPNHSKPFLYPISSLSEADQIYISERLKSDQRKISLAEPTPHVARSGLNDRMKRYAVEYDLPTHAGLPWYQPMAYAPFRLGKKARAEYARRWQKFADIIALSTEHDYLGIDDKTVTKYTALSSVPPPSERIGDALHKLQTRAPKFILHHFDPAEHKRYIRTFNYKNRGVSQVRVNTQPWQGESPIARAATIERFVGEQHHAIQKMKIEFPLRIVISYPVYVSRYDHQGGFMPLTIKVKTSAESSLASGLPLPPAISSQGSGSDEVIPLARYVRPNRWPTDPQTAAQYGKPDGKSRDGTRTLYLAHQVRVDSLPAARSSEEQTMPLLATVETATLFADETLRQRLHTFEIESSKPTAVQSPLVEGETVNSTILPSDYLQMASLMLTKDEKFIDARTWKQLWYQQRLRDNRVPREDPGRPFFPPTRERIYPSKGNLSPNAIESLKKYMIDRGSRCRTLEVRCNFKTDGFGPKLNWGKDNTQWFEQFGKRSTDHSVVQYMNFNFALNKRWSAGKRSRFNFEVGGTRPDWWTAGLTMTTDEIVRVLPQTVRDQIAKDPTYSFARVELDILDCEFTVHKESMKWFVIYARPRMIEISQVDRTIEINRRQSWQNQVRLLATCPIDPGEDFAEPSENSITAQAVQPDANETINQTEAVELTPASLSLLAVKYVDKFLDNKVDQLMLARWSHEKAFRRYPSENKYGVEPQHGSFFGENQASPNTSDLRDQFRDRFSSWLKMTAATTSNRFKVKIPDFEFQFDKKTQVLSPAMFSASENPPTMPKRWSRMFRLYGQSRGLGLELSFEEYETRKKDKGANPFYGWVRDYTRYERLSQTPSTEIHLTKVNPNFVLKDLDGNTASMLRDGEVRTNSYGIPITTPKDNRPVHPVLRIDKEIWLPKDAGLDDDKRPPAIELTFTLTKASLQPTAPEPSKVGAYCKLVNLERDKHGEQAQDQGDYLIIEAAVESAILIDEESGKRLFPLDTKPLRKTLPVRKSFKATNDGNE